ncbi:MAG: hypothetical protein RL141_9 [Candidatus Parcubacteria bacterium]
MDIICLNSTVEPFFKRLTAIFGLGYAFISKITRPEPIKDTAGFLIQIMRPLEFPKISALLDWTKQKIPAHYADRTVYFFEQEIWWARIGENIGSEENGKNERFERPVLVLRKISKDLFWALPITTTIRKGSWYYAFLFRDEQRSLILPQLRALSSKRLIRRVDRMSDHDFMAVCEKIRAFVPTKANPPTNAGGFSDPLARTM